MAALDAEIAQGIHSRDARRRHIVGEILKRMAAAEKKSYTEEQLNATSDVIAMLTGSVTCDALATGCENLARSGLSSPQQNEPGGR